MPNGTTKSTGRSLRDRKKVDYKEDQTSGRSEANRLAKREVTRKRREKAKAKRKKGKNDAWEKMMGVK